MTQVTTVDVLVVGAGPAGLTVAGDLARLGRSVVVLERWPTRNPASRAFATMPRTLELLDSRGLTDELLPLGGHTQHVDLFAGATLHLDRLPSPFPFALITPQSHIDSALEGYAGKHGARIERDHDVVALEQDADGVTVTTTQRAGGAATTWRALWVVAADGAHSTVRSLLAIDFPGRTVLSSVVLADVRLTHPPAGDGLTVGATAETFGFLAPYGSRGDEPAWYRSMTWDRRHPHPDTTPVDDPEIGAILTEALGRDVGVAEISWRSRFHCDERQVEQYRHGRILLVGDAAHVHSPVGGQGMNTGIQDAVNLAWKLDAVLGGARDAVLDTYHDERHPVGRRVLFQSGTGLRAITLHRRPARALRDLLAPRLLRWRWFADLVSGSFSGIGLRYPSPRGEDHLVGTRVVEVPLREGSLTRLQRTPGFVLVRERGAARVCTDLPQAERTDDGPALLVRPDGYAAWGGSTAAAGGGAGWRAALARWTR